MSRTVGARAAAQSTGGTRLREWQSRLGRWNPPVRNPRFWATQVLVLVIAIAHTAVESSGLLSWLGHVYFLPISLFFIPVIYAALYFGLSGAVATALWCTLLSVPNWIFLHHGSESYGAMLQMAIIGAMAVFVGNRVDHQTRARADAEAAWLAGQESEARYRGLFETSGEGVVVIDADDRVIESNAAAGNLLRQPVKALVGRRLGEILAPDGSRGSRGAFPAGPISIVGPDGGETWIEPVEALLAVPGGVRQVVLRDITEQKRRQLGLETYAAHVVRAQEEERQRIAQELHDDTVQSLVLLWRTLNEIPLAAAKDPDATGTALFEARDLAGSIAESVRGYARGLRPPILDDLGLAPAIRRLATEFTARSDTPANLVIRGNARRLAPDVELALFRIAQESLRNAEKHASAGFVRLILSYSPACTTLSVKDDGRGFVLPGRNKVDGPYGLGLVGMEERARMAGGTLTIRPHPGRGTTITARIPDRDGRTAAMNGNAAGNS